MTFTYEYPRPEVVVVSAVFGIDDDGLKVLLRERLFEPFQGHWALPGGYLRENEALETTLRRELLEDTGLSDVFLDQIQTFGDPSRDLRSRILAVSYLGQINIRDQEVRRATDKKNVDWFPLHLAPPLAFDHDEILHSARNLLANKARFQPLGLKLLPHRFTLDQLHQLYEEALRIPINQGKFRKKIFQTNLLKELSEAECSAEGSDRLFEFDHQRYRLLMKKGLFLDF